MNSDKKVYGELRPDVEGMEDIQPGYALWYYRRWMRGSSTTGTAANGRTQSFVRELAISKHADSRYIFTVLGEKQDDWLTGEFCTSVSA